ncbi:ferritin 2 light chain isoform X2 [Halictus rubicundus]|uniref:ferritin 2 light chain isoform X2 n=1 Tax=Halictus rubicundus TaxID=77578 RepID=UPI0040375387
MLFFCVLPLLLAAATAENCYKQIGEDCDTKHDQEANKKESCTAVYGVFSNNESSKTSTLTLLQELQGFANQNMKESFHLLLISSYFGNYNVPREGFKKLYRKYSDKLWEDSINVMKYIAKRGGVMNFEQPSHSVSDSNIPKKIIPLFEIQSLALVLDKQKNLAEKAFQIHNNALAHTHKDPAIAHYIEERFLEAHTDRIRDLSGYITELKSLSPANNSISSSIFVFDEYLQKSL